MNFSKTYSLAIIALTIITIGCSTKQQAADDSVPMDESSLTLTPDQFKAIGIVLGNPETRTMSDHITANGKLDVPPQNLVTVSAPLGGFVKNTHLLQGMYVRKGEVLVEVQDPEYIQLQQDYLEGASELELAKAEFERQDALAKENVNAQKTLQQAKSHYEILQAKVSGLKAKLAIINIKPSDIEGGNIQEVIRLRSSINGYVTDVNVNLGQHVNPSDALFKLVDTSHLHAELYVFEQDIPKLKIDQKVTFNLINETKQRAATVHLIGREISNERTVRVHCHLDEEDKNLLPGMYIKASIEVNSGEARTLPDDAIVNFEGTHYVFTTPDEKTFTMEKVTTGTSQDGFTSVTFENSDQNRSVVLKGAYVLLSKLKNSEEEE